MVVFFIYFKDKKELSSECQCKTHFFFFFFRVKLFFSSNLVKVIGFRDFFWGGGFLNPVWNAQ